MAKNWAIAIGINHYDNLQPLSYAQQDAAAMRDYFLNEAGFEQVYYFAEDAPAIELDYGPPFKPLPTFAKLERFLNIRFENQDFLGSGDNFWFFFAGHGKRHNNRDYLLPSDVNPRNLERTAISITTLTENLCRSGADNVILLLDACRSQDEGDRDGEGIGIEKQRGVVTLFSCSPNERSYEIDQLQHGSFTHTLLQGLRIQGEGNCATVERLDQHLRYQVPEVNRYYEQPRQTPSTKADPPAKYHLILLPRHATVRDAETLKMEAFKAETARNYELAEQFWIRVLTVSPADPDAIDAIRRIAKVCSEKQTQIDTYQLPSQFNFIDNSNCEREVKATSLKQKVLQSMKHRTILPLGNLLCLTIVFCLIALAIGSQWVVTILSISAGTLLFLYIAIVILCVRNT